MLSGPEDFQNPLPLDFFLKTPEGFFKRLVFSHQNFRHSDGIIPASRPKSISIPEEVGEIDTFFQLQYSSAP